MKENIENKSDWEKPIITAIPDYALVEIKKIDTRELLEYLGVEVYQKNALCINHDDHHPSMHVYDNSVFCFSCNYKADNIGIVERLCNFNFVDSCKFLMKYLDIEFTDDYTLSDYTSKRNDKKEAQDKHEEMNSMINKLSIELTRLVINEENDEWTKIWDMFIEVVNDKSIKLDEKIGYLELFQKNSR